MSTVMVATRALLTLMVCCMPLAACQAQLPPDKFDHTKTVSLTKEQREQMDVAFFNDFVVRDMPAEMWRSGANHPRGQRIRKLADEGFELAWLAARFYDFDRMGFKDTPNAEHYWQRVKALADSGDASAQCFIWLAAEELELNGFYKPPKADVENRAHYLKLAVAQGQPECMGSWGGYPDKGPKKHAEFNLQAAKKGCVRCMARVSTFYQAGMGFQKNLSKAWCWATEAVLSNDSVMYENDRRTLYSSIRALKSNDMGRPEDLAQYRPGNHCSDLIATTASSTGYAIKPTKGSK